MRRELVRVRCRARMALRIAALGGVVLALAGCLEQESRAQQVAPAQQARTQPAQSAQPVRMAQAAQVPVQPAAGKGNPVITGSLPGRVADAGAAGEQVQSIDAFLKKLKSETRQRKLQALQMREQVAAYKEAVREAREEVARHRLDIARIQEEIRKEREEIEKYRAEMEALRRQIVELAAGIRKDRDFIQRIATDAEGLRREMARIREGVLKMRDDLLPKVDAVREAVEDEVLENEVAKAASQEDEAEGPPALKVNVKPPQKKPATP